MRAAPGPRGGVKRPPPWTGVGRVGRCPGVPPGRDIWSVGRSGRPAGWVFKPTIFDVSRERWVGMTRRTGRCPVLQSSAPHRPRKWTEKRGKLLNF